MRYITDGNGYLREVSFGADIDCDDGTCTEYTGTVPAAYESVEDWYIFNSDRLHQWQIVGGNLVEDGSRPEPEDCLLIPIERGGTGADTVAGARAALGLGDTDGPLPIECGGTGATTLEDARAALGIEDVQTGGAAYIGSGSASSTSGASFYVDDYYTLFVVVFSVSEGNYSLVLPPGVMCCQRTNANYYTWEVSQSGHTVSVTRGAAEAMVFSLYGIK